MAPSLVEQYMPLVSRFVDAIKVDFRISEAIAQRGSALAARRTSPELAGSASLSE